MIVKELDPFSSDDKFAKAGRAAEEQMAFYFKRFFATDPEFFILNGIRLEADGDAAQVDHLVIHSHGLIFVESKSVNGKIQIKEDGQWIRWFGANQSRGMASPLTQVRLQERFFRSVLGKAAKNEVLFAQLPIDIFVAISDDGVILWPPSGPINEVCKADQVPDKIIQLQRTRVSGGGVVLSSVNREKIAAYLLARNRPLARAPSTVNVNPIVPEPALQPGSTSQDAAEETGSAKGLPAPVGPTCRSCNSQDLAVQYGKFGYYFKCNGCGGNTPIRIDCGVAGHKERIRKDGRLFYRECADCKTSSLYFENAMESSRDEGKESPPPSSS